MDSITTLLGMCGDGPKMTDVEFGRVIYRLNKWADEANVLRVMTCHLRKQARDATSNNVRIGDMYGAGSQTWAASDVWALWRVEDHDASYDTHFLLRCLKGRFCEIDTAWKLDGCMEDLRTVSSVLLTLQTCFRLKRLRSRKRLSPRSLAVASNGPRRRSAYTQAANRSMHVARCNHC